MKIKSLVMVMIVFLAGCSQKDIQTNNSNGSSSNNSGPSQPVQGSGNADTVDGFHASNVPAPNTLLALNQNAKLPADITGDANTLDGFDSDVFVKKGEISASSLIPTSLDGYVGGTLLPWDEYTHILTSPVEGVKVEIEQTGLFTTTDSNGYFSFNNLAPGTYFIKFTKDGYCPRRWQYSIIGNMHLSSITLSPLPSTPSSITVTPQGSGKVMITGKATPQSIITVFLSTSPTGLQSCYFGGTYQNGDFSVYISDLTSGQTYYYQLLASFWDYLDISDQPVPITNPPYCASGYAFTKSCVSERTPLSSFVAP